MAPGLRAPLTQTRWQAEEATLGEDSMTSACTCWIEVAPCPCGSGDQRSCTCKHMHTK